MAEEKAPRPVAGDVGTDSRIEADAGHYWVRLWSREAIHREGAAMGNCLRHGDYDGFAGSEDPLERGLWSLRRSDGASIGLAELGKSESEHRVREFLGVGNSPASKLAYRQLRHLNAAFVTLGSRLTYDGVRNDPVVVGPDGMTYRWDRAPEGFRLPDHDERMERRRGACERRAAHQARLYGGIDIPVGDPPAGGEPEVIYYEAAVPARPARGFWVRNRDCEQEDTTRWVNLFLGDAYRPPATPPLPDPGYVERLAHALGIPKEQNAELVKECIEALEGDRPSSQAAQPLVEHANLGPELRAIHEALVAGVIDHSAWERAVSGAVETFETRTYTTFDGRVVLGQPRRRVPAPFRLTADDRLRLLRFSQLVRGDRP